MSIEDDIQQPKFKSIYSKVLINLIYTSNWLKEREMSILKPYKLTVSQYNVLRILRGQKGKPATINLIIDRMLDRMSNASRIVDKLEDKGLVTRKQCPNDRRAVDVIISKKGLDLLNELDPKMSAWEKKFKILSQTEAENLSELLDKLRLAK
ncbi:MarR family transcriptional regulator [Fulvivirgaceae bacterium BMA10]|uniref:MarR family transcriptional regulator n=1 Tax=Splendidivirga corallicola TaxID=3051826 RepID=A0ABT8KYJ8_9BACT|nr:MarR family transcriptional regulator [Fulvivirgaceae bacterium BMA10]